MSESRDHTTMGGIQEGFLTTQWSQIANGGTADSQKRRVILDYISLRYWKPVYCYLRRKGYSNDQAKDLTQGFFCDIVLNSRLVQRADRAKGRFRTFLLTALECYLADQHRHRAAKSRSPKGTVVSLDDTDVPELPAATTGMDPPQMFSYVWATQILDEALAEVERQCLCTHKEIHWRLFQEKVLHPIMNGQPGPPWASLCARHAVPDERTASNMIITVKRCFHRVLEDRLRRQVAHASDLQEEFHDLFRHMGRRGAG